MSRQVGNVVTAALLALLLALLYVAITPRETRPAGPRPCVTDADAGPCRWDADERGNGEGRSFTIHPDGSLEYDDTTTTEA